MSCRLRNHQKQSCIGKVKTWRSWVQLMFAKAEVPIYRLPLQPPRIQSFGGFPFSINAGMTLKVWELCPTAPFAIAPYPPRTQRVNCLVLHQQLQKLPWDIPGPFNVHFMQKKYCIHMDFNVLDLLMQSEFSTKHPREN